MQVTAITDNPFAPTSQFLEWANDSYENTWTRHLPNEPIQLAPLDLRKVVSGLYSISVYSL